MLNETEFRIRYYGWSFSAHAHQRSKCDQSDKQQANLDLIDKAVTREILLQSGAKIATENMM